VRPALASTEVRSDDRRMVVRPAAEQLRRRQAKEALRLADNLLNGLEELQFRGRVRVPAGYGKWLERLRQAAATVGISSVRNPLEPHLGILRLMDDIFELEAKLLVRCRPGLRASA